MKRNILFSMRALVLAALVPLAGCLVEESVEEEDIDDSGEQIGAGDDVGVEGDGGISLEKTTDPSVESVAGVVLPGQDTQADPVPLPWTGSQSSEEDDDENPFGPPPVEAASKTSDGVYDPN